MDALSQHVGRSVVHIQAELMHHRDSFAKSLENIAEHTESVKLHEFTTAAEQILRGTNVKILPRTLETIFVILKYVSLHVPNLDVIATDKLRDSEVSKETVSSPVTEPGPPRLAGGVCSMDARIFFRNSFMLRLIRTMILSRFVDFWGCPNPRRKPLHSCSSRRASRRSSHSGKFRSTNRRNEGPAATRPRAPHEALHWPTVLHRSQNALGSPTALEEWH